MILSELVDYYDRLAADAGSGVAPPGYSVQRVSFVIVLADDGSLVRIEDAAVEEEVPAGQWKTKRVRKARQMLVPGQAKPSGCGLNPGFLWDNVAYMLGYVADGTQKDRDRAVKAFEELRARHTGVRSLIADPGFDAVARFLQRWSPSDAESYAQVLSGLENGFGVFKRLSDDQYVHERQKVRAWWDANLSGTEASDVSAPSLLSDQVKPIARLHEPKIKGVVGGQSSGGVLVGFNAPAFESYAKEQSYNAPVGADEAFKYCTALNHLLTDPARRVRLADATVVFWAERPTQLENVFALEFNEPSAAMTQGAEDSKQVDRVGTALRRVRDGLSAADPAEGENGFYVLGLAPNAARVSVRFFLQGTVAEFRDRLNTHLDRLAIVGDNDRPPTINQMVFATARHDDDGRPDYDSVNPRLAGEIARSVLAGTPYPQHLMGAILRRITADGVVNATRAGIVKAVLIRNYSREVHMLLDERSDSAPYLLGRLFALLEKTQEDVSGGKLNRTIKDSYINGAATAPASVFPRILKIHQHHIEKMEGGLKTIRARDVQSVVSRLASFPRSLRLEEQGQFFIGYYTQRQDLFTKKSKPNEPEPEGEKP